MARERSGHPPDTSGLAHSNQGLTIGLSVGSASDWGTFIVYGSDTEKQADREKGQTRPNTDAKFFRGQSKHFRTAHSRKRNKGISGESKIRREWLSKKGPARAEVITSGARKLSF